MKNKKCEDTGKNLAEQNKFTGTVKKAPCDTKQNYCKDVSRRQKIVNNRVKSDFTFTVGDIMPFKQGYRTEDGCNQYNIYISNIIVLSVNVQYAAESSKNKNYQRFGKME